MSMNEDIFFPPPTTKVKAPKVAKAHKPKKNKKKVADVPSKSISKIAKKATPPKFVSPGPDKDRAEGFRRNYPQIAKKHVGPTLSKQQMKQLLKEHGQK